MKCQHKTWWRWGCSTAFCSVGCFSWATLHKLEKLHSANFSPKRSPLPGGIPSLRTSPWVILGHRHHYHHHHLCQKWLRSRWLSRKSVIGQSKKFQGFLFSQMFTNALLSSSSLSRLSQSLSSYSKLSNVLKFSLNWNQSIAFKTGNWIQAQDWKVFSPNPDLDYIWIGNRFGSKSVFCPRRWPQ